MIPVVEGGLGAYIEIFKQSFFELMEEVIPIPVGGPVRQLLNRRNTPGSSTVVGKDLSETGELTVNTTGIVQTTWIEDDTGNLPMGTVELLIREALPSYHQILEKLGFGGDVTVALGAGLVQTVQVGIGLVCRWFLRSQSIGRNSSIRDSTTCSGVKCSVIEGHRCTSQNKTPWNDVSAFCPRGTDKQRGMMRNVS